MTIPDKFTKALTQIITSLEGKGISWALTGSMGFALQGVPVTPNDIDLQTDTRGAYEIEQILCDCITRSVTPKTIEGMRIVVGRLDIEDVQVDIVGGVQKKQLDGSYELPVDIEEHKLFVEYQGMQVPVLNLNYEQKAYLRLGRLEKAAMLSDWLAEQENS